MVRLTRVGLMGGWAKNKAGEWAETKGKGKGVWIRREKGGRKERERVWGCLNTGMNGRICLTPLANK